MNREILFKAKRKDWKELPKEEWWVEGLPSYDISGNVTEFEVYKEFTNCETFEIDYDTLCEYTGLTDKNGRKIFEGDIIKVCTFGFNTERFITEIIYDKCAFRLKNGRNMFYYGQSDFTRMDDSKVVGNVFDNPELLKGGGTNEKQ